MPLKTTIATKNVENQPFSIQRFEAGNLFKAEDDIAIEAPLEIKLGQPVGGRFVAQPLAITMRTPGLDKELAAGLLYAEGIIEQPGDIKTIWRDPEEKNSLTVILARGGQRTVTQRNLITHAGCGICSKSIEDSLELLMNSPCAARDFLAAPEWLMELPTMVRSRQQGFSQSGGLHAAASFSRSGSLSGLCEDIGRHNTVDKLIGQRILKGQALHTDPVLFLSGRAGYELIQKAVRAGFQMVTSIGAPSSMAVRMAHRFGLTLVGFLRSTSFNVYTHSYRITDKRNASNSRKQEQQVTE